MAAGAAANERGQHERQPRASSVGGGWGTARTFHALGAWGRLGAHSPRLMDAIFEAYLDAQRRRRASPLTLKAVQHALGSAQRWLDAEGIQAGELTLLRCEEYFDWLLDRGAISTARRHLAYVRAAYRYGVRHQLAEFDPTADVKLPRLPDIEPATYSDDELRQIHAAIRSEREDVAFHLLAFAGLRLGETAALTWANVDLDHWQLRLTGKG